MRNRLRVFCAVSLLLVPGTAFADATVTAIGSVFCFNGIVPLAGVRVELMDSDCDGSEICDDVLATGKVDPATGAFRLVGRGGDPFGGDPDVYVRFAYNDDAGVRLANEADVTLSYSTPQHDNNNTPDGAIIDFGRIVIDSGAAPDENPNCQIFTAVRNAYRDYVDRINPAHMAPPAGHVDILAWSAIWAGTPWTNTDTIHWPIDFSIRVATHEFGHSIRHAADGSPAHFAADVAAYRYARYHDKCAADANQQPDELLASVRAYNFNEGWADYWESDFRDCGSLPTDMGEISVAKYLNAYEKGNMLSKMDMVNVLIANPGAIHNIDEFGDKLAAHLGVSRGPLQTRADNWLRTLSEVPTTVRDPRAYTTQQMSQLTSKALAAVDSQIADRRRTAARALAEGSRTRKEVCRGARCEAVFHAIVRSILLQGEAAALDAYASNLRAARSPQWSATVQRVRAEGRFDAWFAEYRRDLQNRMRAAMLQAFTKAETALSRARRQMPDAYDVYARELAKGKARLSPAGGGERGTGGKVSFWAPQIP